MQVLSKFAQYYMDIAEDVIVPIGNTYILRRAEDSVPYPIKESHVCLFPKPIPDSWKIESSKEFENLDDAILLGLPFKNIWIESPYHMNSGQRDYGISILDIQSEDKENILEMCFMGGFLSTIVDSGVPRLEVRAVMMATRMGPNKQPDTRMFTVRYNVTSHLLNWCSNKVDEQNKGHYVEHLNDEQMIYTLVIPSIYPVCSFLNSLKNKEVILGSERVNERIRIGSGKDRELIKIKEVVHVALHRKDSPLPKLSREGRIIDWTHRWEVMGHWRRITGVGKDPQGQYGIQGFTWVLPHEKGPENKPVIKKIRIVAP